MAEPVETVEVDAKGEVTSRYTLVNGLLEGELTQFGPGGSVSARQHFHAGVLEGEGSEWSPAGKLVSRAQFRGGLPHGERVAFDDAGRLEQRVQFVAGKLSGKAEFFHRGQLQTEIEFLEGQRHGRFVAYGETGHPSLACHYKEGELEGEASYFGPDGKLLRKANYAAGELEGEALDDVAGAPPDRLHQDRALALSAGRQGDRDDRLVEHLFEEFGSLQPGEVVGQLASVDHEAEARPRGRTRGAHTVPTRGQNRYGMRALRSSTLRRGGLAPW